VIVFTVYTHYTALGPAAVFYI